jgi:hypothetical protein
MLLVEAARYADVSVQVLETAIAAGLLPVRSIHHLGHDGWTVHSRHLEAWAAGRDDGRG